MCTLLESLLFKPPVHSSVLGGGCGDSSGVNDWTVQLPAVPKPPVIPPTPPADGSPTRKILHLSDVHLDLSYEIGALAACDLPNCCMGFLGQSERPEDGAQYWGDYRSKSTLRAETLSLFVRGVIRGVYKT